MSRMLFHFVIVLGDNLSFGIDLAYAVFLLFTFSIAYHEIPFGRLHSMLRKFYITWQRNVMQQRFVRVVNVQVFRLIPEGGYLPVSGIDGKGVWRADVAYPVSYFPWIPDFHFPDTTVSYVGDVDAFRDFTGGDILRIFGVLAKMSRRLARRL